jgi:hypothetical protein
MMSLNFYNFSSSNSMIILKAPLMDFGPLRLVRDL